MFRIEFLGVGNAFSTPECDDLNVCDWQSNLLITSQSGKHLLLDCGSDIRFSMKQAGYTLADIDALYVSHAHADHIGGIEYLAFSTFFNPKLKRSIDLFCASVLSGPLWTQSLKGGLDSIEGMMVDLTHYFNLRRIPKNRHFVWEGIRFDLIQVVHAMVDKTIKPSYGLMISQPGGPKVFWTSDTQFCPRQIEAFYGQADLILHDCETSPYPSGVHAHYSDMKMLKPEDRIKMVLYHYHPGAPEQLDAVADGFKGFARKGDVFTIDGSISWTHRT